MTQCIHARLLELHNFVLYFVQLLQNCRDPQFNVITELYIKEGVALMAEKLYAPHQWQFNGAKLCKYYNWGLFSGGAT